MPLAGVVFAWPWAHAALPAVAAFFVTWMIAGLRRGALDGSAVIVSDAESEAGRETALRLHALGATVFAGCQSEVPLHAPRTPSTHETPGGPPPPNLRFECTL